MIMLKGEPHDPLSWLINKLNNERTLDTRVQDMRKTRERSNEQATVAVDDWTTLLPD